MKYRNFFWSMFAIVLLSSFVVLIVPLLIQVWESSEEGLSIQRIFVLLGFMVIAKALSILFTILRERFAKEYNKKNFFSMLSDFLSMDYDLIIEKGPANIVEKIAISVNGIYSYMTGDYIQRWSAIVLTVASIAFIANVDFRVALALLLILPINYFGYKLLNKELARRSQQMQKLTGAGFQEVLSTVQQVDYLKQCADHQYILNSLNPSSEKIYGSMAQVNQYAQTMSALLDGVNEIARNAALIYIVYNFINTNENPYALILYTIVVPLYFSSVSTIVSSNVNRRDFSVALDFQKELENGREQDGQKALSSIETMEFNVEQIEIPGRKIPFHAIAALKKGDIVKICGDSGAGKSSFAKALVKFRGIQEVRLNGIPLCEFRNEDVRRCMEYLSQNVPIIKGSLRNNLFFNRSHDMATEREFEQEPLLKSILSDKTLDTEIMEEGANLSGGEKQKIALARAFANHSDVLILDEICSNIDKPSADAIYERLAADRNKRITIIITHDDLPEGLVNIELNR